MTISLLSIQNGINLSITPNLKTIQHIVYLHHPHLNPLPAYAKALADRPSRARK